MFLLLAAACAKHCWSDWLPDWLAVHGCRCLTEGLLQRVLRLLVCGALACAVAAALACSMRRVLGAAAVTVPMVCLQTGRGKWVEGWGDKWR